jgi:dTDP-4-dehydrorhamnose 3,5-epimerase-like enzyme
MHGSCNVYIDNGITATNYILDIPNKMIILPPGYWGDLIDFVDDCVLLVLASDYYDESDYIRNYDEYIKYVQDREKNSLL